jgi:hypothetical protein
MRRTSSTAARSVFPTLALVHTVERLPPSRGTLCKRGIDVKCLHWDVYIIGLRAHQPNLTGVFELLR